MLDFLGPEVGWHGTVKETSESTKARHVSGP
jgi:hypothetical protein